MKTTVEPVSRRPGHVLPERREAARPVLSKAKAYNDLFEHLADEIGRVRLLIRLAAVDVGSPFEGDDRTTLIKALENLKNQIDSRLESVPAGQPAFPLLRLRQSFALSQADSDIVTICIALALDKPSLDLARGLLGWRSAGDPPLELFFRVLTRTPSERMQLKERLIAQSSLRRRRLAWLMPPQQANSDGLLFNQETVRLEKRIADYALGSEYTDPETAPYAWFAPVSTDGSYAYLSDELCSQMEELEDGLEAHLADRHAQIFFHGPAGTGKSNAAASLAAKLGAPLLEVNLRALMANPERLEIGLKILREARLFGAALLFQNSETMDAGDAETSRFREGFLHEAAHDCFLCIFSAERLCSFVDELQKGYFAVLEFPLPSYDVRQRAWEDSLLDGEAFSGKLTTAELAAKFKFTTRQITRAISYARNRSLVRGQNGRLADDDLIEGCRLQNRHNLGDRAAKVQAAFSWENLVLPSDQIRQLKEVCEQHRHRGKVYGEWAFSERLAYGRGQNVLFSGQSGTGKTLAASIIANELRLELFKIDLSSVVSKYIGETEKNLSQVFQAAERSNAILFFDEADALFGKRTEVKDAHDRYANVETSYLLQKMEEYEGITILATNLKQNMDEAFTRRMHAIVQFPFPDVENRERIWKITFPAEAPLDTNIDWGFLAERLDVSGGNIKSIVVAAAFFAAAEGASISMRHLMRAARREWQKLGREYAREDFEPYFSLGITE